MTVDGQQTNGSPSLYGAWLWYLGVTQGAKGSQALCREAQRNAQAGVLPPHHRIPPLAAE